MSAVHPATHVAKTSSWYNTLGPSDESRTGPKAFALPALEPPKEDSGDDLKLKGEVLGLPQWVAMCVVCTRWES